MTTGKKIIIPENLFRQLQVYLEESIFASVEDLAAYILQDFLDKHTTKSPKEKKIVEERLRNLGYL